MKTNELLQILEDNADKRLLFEYLPGRYVNKNYHITEVKNTRIESVDCGAREDAWNETIIQLWESPKENEDRDYMSIYKALGILKKVDKMRPMDRESRVKFEYSNPEFHTSQLEVSGYDVRDGKLIMVLHSQPTDCKAKEDCGVHEHAMVQVAQEPCCDPNSGCC
jgi:hypothetical protein